MNTADTCGFGPPHILVGTLNLLGDAFNPFEFLPLSDSESMKHHAALKAKFQELRWSDVEEFSNALFKDLVPQASIQEALGRLCSHGQNSPVFSYFDKEVLKNDNKFIQNRTNLLTMALKPCGDKTQCDLLDPGALWMDNLRSQVVSEGPSTAYATDSNLFLWDLVCNVVASSCKDAYKEICRGSYLNPANYEAVGNRFFAEVDAHNTRGLPIVLGFEEFPSEVTTRGKNYESVLEKRNYTLLRGPGSTAIVYRGFAQNPHILTASSINSEAIMQSCIDDVCKEGIELSDAQKKGFLKTTARKTFAVHLESIVFILVHVKEPKTSGTAILLARYMRTLGAATLNLNPPEGAWKSRAWVLMTDSNLGSVELAQHFKDMLAAESLGAAADWMPEPVMMTTSKHRSVLHGQCYDTAKCEKTVVAPKDYIVASQQGSLKECRVSPCIENGSATTLPTPDWGTDHCLVTAVYSPFGGTCSGVMKAFCEAYGSGSGEMPEEDLRALFRSIGQMIVKNEDIDAMLKESGACSSSAGKVKYKILLQWIFSDL